MSSSIASYLQLLEFKLKVYAASGNSYQDLFSAVMSYSLDDFKQVRPFAGDGGNDGYVKSRGWYFQIYGPEILTSESSVTKTAREKIRADFIKLLENWDNIKRYIFVFNDRFGGIPTPLIVAIEKLGNEYPEIEFDCFSSRNLLANFLALKDIHKNDIVGILISDDNCYKYDYSAIVKVLEGLTKTNRGELYFDISLTAPDLVKKIKFNGLSMQISDLIKIKSRNVSLLDDYFKSSPSDEQQVAIQMQELYANSKKVIPNTDENYEDLRYLWIRKKMIPLEIMETVRLSPPLSLAYNDASDLVIAKYFESCDIYEPPTSIDSE